MCGIRITKKMKKYVMYPVYVRFLCLFQTVWAQPTNLLDSRTFPPRGNFCFFTSSEFVFRVIMTEVAPSAKFQGAGKLKNIYAYLPNAGDPVTVSAADPQTPLELKNLWGVVYYIAQDDYSKIEELASKQSMISDVMVEVHTDPSQEGGQAMECISTDTGLLPQAFPLPVHAKFSQEVCCRSYLDRLAEVGVPQDYIVSLAMLPSTRNLPPRPAALLSFPLSVLSQHNAQSDSYGVKQVSAASYELPSNKFCVFTASELIFPDAMTKLAPSATLIGAGMLMDDYIGLGGKTQPDRFVKFEGFDHVWGAAYEVDQKDLYTFLAYGQQFFFMADVQAEVKGQGGATCKTFDVGLLPSAFPFAVFRENKVDVQKYIKQLQDLGVPAGYVSTISSLADSVNQPNPTNKVGAWVY